MASTSPVTAAEPTGFRGPAHDANGLFFNPEFPRRTPLGSSVNRGSSLFSGASKTNVYDPRYRNIVSVED
jgi:hypothetical protein